MSVEKTLLRVDADLAAGDLAMACQRLRGLVGSFPDHLDLRERLAQIYRLQGNRVQAGRWDYLAAHPDADEVAAFEKATPAPLHRMRALAWVTDPDNAPTPVARERLIAVLDQARRCTGDTELTYTDLRKPSWTPAPDTPGDRVVWALIVSVLVGILLLFVIGVVDGIRVVWSWIG